jgi:hypothetical protein
MPDLAAGARAVLAANWREGVTDDGVPYAYTRPDASKFPQQFFWDSCFHALAWARIEPARARAELRSLLAAQEPSGFIGHTICWDAPVRRSRRPFYNFLGPDDRMTRTIQPPFLGLAWEEVARCSADDPGFASEGLDALARYHDWLERERDLDGDGLLRLIQPDESGLDASPKFDALMGWEAAGFPGFILFVRRSRRDGFDLRRVRARGGFVVAETLVNTAYALSLESLARLGAGERFAARAARVREAMLERLWDVRRGLFLDAGPDGPLDVSTWTSLAPLALPGLPSEVAERLFDEHLLDPRRYWLRFPVPSTSADERAFRPSTRLLRYWRGPTWMATSWLMHRGLLEHGRTDEAALLSDRVQELCALQGFREYYDPYRGTGMGAKAFGMSTLALVIAEAYVPDAASR